MKSTKKAFNHEVAFTRAKDGRWIAEVATLPGVKGCARTRKEALAQVQSAALRALVDRMAQRNQP